ncbi:ribonuclease H-like domain-containing protein [Aspergillus pseudonomiae]|uniref:ribonuclease H n=1 Tax=Aspergillus pseudonomiae TaxID=1506151 RepID=A0A5N6IEA7_9EURO|nr:ribonuclease H-like domain-containing protein [Aspergillus pseudonomiae]KAB8264139.1 ribonuclease H-like domain-containing protein [Aspergillus pseudonomiae]KAE8405640.1 ribonuclease H-like domain-containing protein [Aspergillus pseudonomiae]
MEIYTDSSCRGNGQPGAIGAAAAVLKNGNGEYNTKTESLPPHPPPTKLRAEITAIILALKLALERYDELATRPQLKVTIYSDSTYAFGCMTKCIHKWADNGWTNAASGDVVNRDLLEEAFDLDKRLKEVGEVEYVWSLREKDQLADRLCNENMEGQS